MTALRHWRLACVLLLLLLCFAAAACGGGAGQPGGQEQTAAGQPSGQDPAAGGGQDSGGGGGGQPSAGGGGGAPGAPSNRSNGAQAKGAPIKIPAFTERGVAISVAKPDFEQKLIDEACKDGTLCVKVQVRPSDADPTTCGFDYLDPPSGRSLERDQTVTMVCTPGSAPNSEESSQETTGSTEDSQQQPTDTTAPTEDSQPTSTS
jgi:hypothetical protein